MGRISPSRAAAGSVVGAPSASTAQPAGIGSPRCLARYTLPRATAVLAMSMTRTSWPPAGAAIDHGLVPTVLRRPPQGAMAGLALVVRMATQPSRAAIRGEE